MKTPKSIEPLIYDGLVDEVVCSLRSGKEATVYIVSCNGKHCCAKVYKDVDKRSFRQQAQYKEGRKVRNSRRARAMEKSSRYGKKEQESAWQNAEVEALYRLDAAGVRVPKPHGFFDGVLLMELIADEDGNAAPRLNDIEFSAEEARIYHQFLIQQIVLMLCAGVVHGDLSEFNVLVDENGPVIIDLPQAVDAAGNNNARSMLERDVSNMANYFGRYAPELLDTEYGSEIWQLYENGDLHPGAVLTGRTERDDRIADVDAVLREIKAALLDAEARRARANPQEED